MFFYFITKHYKGKFFENSDFDRNDRLNGFPEAGKDWTPTYPKEFIIQFMGGFV